MNINLEGSKELTKALVDTFSPVTEIIGSLGDKVRVYRQLSLMRTLQKAQKLAAAEGITLSAPPIKFLVPFMEECSLEDENDQDLISLWSNLLVSASEAYKSEHNLFLRLINEISSEEVRLMEYIASKKHPSDESWFMGDSELDWRDDFVFIKIRELIQDSSHELNEDFDFEDLESRFKRLMETPGNIVSHLSVDQGVKNEYPYASIHDSEEDQLDAFSNTSISILKHLGLIGHYASSELWYGSFVIQVQAYYMTVLGTQFYAACARKPVSFK